jgi:hypothetical protein
VSTLEHVGVGWYDRRSDPRDDARLMHELRAIVRPAGIVLLTVPFGRRATGRTQRVYDRERLMTIADGWSVEELAFYVRKGAAWGSTSEQEASSIDSEDVTGAVALMRLRRI